MVPECPRPPRSHPRRRLALVAALSVVSVGAGEVAAQSSAVLGLRGVGAVGLTAGATDVERGIRGGEGRFHVDLGHFSSSKLRLGADVSFLRSSLHRETVELEDSTYSNRVYDLSGHVALQWLLVQPSRAVAPFVRLAIGVHALSSSFGSVVIDQRYNNNAFGLRAGAGLRLRLGARRSLVGEWDAALTREVSRRTVRVGAEVLLGDLAGHGRTSP